MCKFTDARKSICLARTLFSSQYIALTCIVAKSLELELSPIVSLESCYNTCLLYVGATKQFGSTELGAGIRM